MCGRFRGRTRSVTPLTGLESCASLNCFCWTWHNWIYQRVLLRACGCLGSKMAQSILTGGLWEESLDCLRYSCWTKLCVLLLSERACPHHREIEQLISSINAESQNYTHHHKDPTTTKTKNKDKEEYICPKIHSTTTLKKSSVIHDLILALFVMSLNNPSTSLFQLKQGAHFILLYYLLVVQN